MGSVCSSNTLHFYGEEDKYMYLGDNHPLSKYTDERKFYRLSVKDKNRRLNIDVNIEVPSVNIEVPIHTDIFQRLKGVEELHLHLKGNSEMKNVDLPSGLKKLHLHNGALDQDLIDKINCECTELTFDECQIDEKSMEAVLEKCPKLEYLYLSGCEISRLNLALTPHLRTLTIFDKILHPIDQANILSVEKIITTHGNVVFHDLTQFNHLQIQDCAAPLDMEQIYTKRYLHLYLHHQTVDLSRIQADRLTLERCKIDSSKFSDLTVGHFDIYKCGLTKLDLPNIKRVKVPKIGEDKRRCFVEVSGLTKEEAYVIRHEIGIDMAELGEG